MVCIALPWASTTQFSYNAENLEIFGAMQDTQTQNALNTPSEDWDRFDAMVRRLESSDLPTSLSNLVRLGLPEEVKWQLDSMLGLMKLAGFYGRETTKCLSTEAYFAANVMGAATLETLLLLLCIAKEELVRTTPTWRLCLREKGNRS